MSNWPTVPLIRIIKGYDSGRLKEDVIAFRYGGGSNYRGPDCCIIKDNIRDRIDEWEEVTVVPTAALRDLLEAWRGAGGDNLNWLRNVEDAMDPILSCLPADKPSALDRAVTLVKDAGGPMISRGDSRTASPFSSTPSPQSRSRPIRPPRSPWSPASASTGRTSRTRAATPWRTHERGPRCFPTQEASSSSPPS